MFRAPTGIPLANHHVDFPLDVIFRRAKRASRMRSAMARNALPPNPAALKHGIPARQTFLRC
jgi:hypothetical protein